MTNSNPSNLSNEIEDWCYKYRQLIRQETKRTVLNGERFELEEALTTLFNKQIVAELKLAQSWSKSRAHHEKTGMGRYKNRRWKCLSDEYLTNRVAELERGAE